MPRRPAYLCLPPQEAIAYFRQKISIPTEKWDQFEAEQHDFAYTVAGLTRADLLEALQWLIDGAIADGTSFDDFVSQFRRSIARRGWSPEPLTASKDELKASYRMRTLFETPIRRAYGVGRLKQMRDPEMLKRRPYWQWKHRDSIVPRPNHLALHNKVFRADNPFFDIAFPPAAFGCRCGVFSLSERQLKQMGLKVEEPPDPNTIAEKGFRRAPGTTTQRDRKQVLQQGLDRLSPQLKAQVEADLKQRNLL